MKRFFLVALALASAVLFAVAQAESRSLNEIRQVVDNPRLVENTDSLRMNVNFLHKPHKTLGCRTCHHKILEDGAKKRIFVSCVRCHDKTDIADRSKDSYFLAMHRQDSDRSCAGCHARMSEEKPELKGCQSCHSVDSDKF